MNLELRESKPCDHSLELGTNIKVVSNDYNKLRNKPTLNGEEIIGDMSESDPTVPSWAKAANTPTYSYNEVNAVGAENVLSIAEIASMLSSLDPT